MEVDRQLYVLCLVVAFIGGVNWLVTGIRSMMQDNTEVEDLLSLLYLPQVVSNIIYFLVFVCSTILILPLLPKM
jgi:uncharacterized membrane protein YuzA (DUF378 family)